MSLPNHPAPTDTNSRTLHLSSEFCVSCGSITFSPSTQKLLLIRCRKRDEVFLPKGRKDTDESLQAAAMRETYEETGYRITLLPVKSNTCATSPAADPDRAKRENVEPIAMTQRYDGVGILKVIFWFVGQGNSSDEPDLGTQQEWEDFEALWMDYEDVVTALTWEDDKKVARKAIELFKASPTGAASLSQSL